MLSVSRGLLSYLRFPSSTGRGGRGRGLGPPPLGRPGRCKLWVKEEGDGDIRALGEEEGKREEDLCPLLFSPQVSSTDSTSVSQGPEGCTARRAGGGSSLGVTTQRVGVQARAPRSGACGTDFKAGMDRGTCPMRREPGRSLSWGGCFSASWSSATACTSRV